MQIWGRKILAEHATNFSLSHPRQRVIIAVKKSQTHDDDHVKAIV